jgi:hypothetical protein
MNVEGPFRGLLHFSKRSKPISLAPNIGKSAALVVQI